VRISNPTAILGENIATEYLKRKGYKIVERNFRKGYGEIDIICIKEKTLIFVEVKTRTSDKFGTPAESITYSKLMTLIKTAQYYKILNSNLPDQMRIDAILINLENGENDFKLEHIENITA